LIHFYKSFLFLLLPSSSRMTNILFILLTLVTAGHAQEGSSEITSEVVIHKAAPVDCKVSPWGAWGSCSKSCCCGGRKISRREIINPGENGGKPCHPRLRLSKRASCNYHIPCEGACKCGLAKRRSKIVGGEVTEVNEYPWQVGIVYKNDNRVFCGGSLISNRWILSAAHCICSNHAKHYQVLLGEHDYESSSETTEVRMDIIQIIEHGSYSPRTKDYDFTLLKMRFRRGGKFNFAAYPHIRPICLPEDNSKDYNDFVATVTGWGDLFFDHGFGSNTLREVDVKVLTNNECKNNLGYFTEEITDQMLCAGEAGGNGGKDACQDDSGGPLVTSGTGDGVTPGQNYELIGVVSFGEECALADFPGVYARVTSVLSWIKTNGDVLGNTCPRT